MLNLPLKNCSNWQVTFLIKFDESHYKDHPRDDLPGLFFKVFHKDKLIHNTEVVIEVELNGQRKTEAYEVSKEFGD